MNFNESNLEIWVIKVVLCLDDTNGFYGIFEYCFNR